MSDDDDNFDRGYSLLIGIMLISTTVVMTVLAIIAAVLFYPGR